jgi:hypothetical protein
MRSRYDRVYEAKDSVKIDYAVVGIKQTNRWGFICF